MAKEEQDEDGDQEDPGEGEEVGNREDPPRGRHAATVSPGHECPRARGPTRARERNLYLYVNRGMMNLAMKYRITIVIRRMNPYFTAA